MAEKKPIPILMERLARILQNDSHAGGLKPAQWEALRYLSRANRFSRSPGAVTAYLGVTKGTVSQTLAALERKGLIKKAIDRADRRGVEINLTRQGTKMLQNDPVITIESVTRQMAAVDRAQLSASLEGVLVQLLRDRGGRPFGACKTCRHFMKGAPQGAPHFCNLLDEPLTIPDSLAICVEQEAAA